MNKKHYLPIALGVLLVLFILQNMTVVDIKFLFWQLSVSRAIMIFILVAIGVIIGWLLHAHYIVRRVTRPKS